MNHPLIKASITIEGPAEELLAALRYIKGGKRSVRLSVEVSTRHYSDRFHFIPEIKDGQTYQALRKLESMSDQTVVDANTDRKLQELISEFGEFTG
jgi:hypothetical protein